jgi:mannosyltransferase OCH1-like enzyme
MPPVKVEIPKTFHRIWLGQEPFPEEYVVWGETWQLHHPDWELVLWTDESLGELERKEVSDPGRVGAERADILRYELLWRHGGVYIDTDLECRRPIDRLVRGLDFFAVWHNPLRHRVNNAVIGSVAGHPIVERAMREARPMPPGEYSKTGTGPVFFDRVVREFSGATLFESCSFYPRTSEERRRAYAVHHEARSWSSANPVERLERNLAASRSRLRGTTVALDEEERRLASLKRSHAKRARRRFRESSSFSSGVEPGLSERQARTSARGRDGEPSEPEIEVPRIFHRMWLGAEMPEELVAYGETWTARHPGWETRLWTEEDLPTLGSRGVLDTALDPGRRAALLRYELLWRYGGVCVDADMECLRSIEPLIRGLRFFTSWHDELREHVSDALIGGIPRHPIFEAVLREARPASTDEETGSLSSSEIFDSVVRRFPEAVLFDSSCLLPRSTRERARAYAIHHEAGSWDTMDRAAQLQRRLDATRSRLLIAVDRLDATKREIAELEKTRSWRAREAARGAVKPISVRLRRLR